MPPSLPGKTSPLFTKKSEKYSLDLGPCGRVGARHRPLLRLEFPLLLLESLAHGGKRLRLQLHIEFAEAVQQAGSLLHDQHLVVEEKLTKNHRSLVLDLQSDNDSVDCVKWKIIFNFLFDLCRKKFGAKHSIGHFNISLQYIFVCCAGNL